jgi:DNA-binding IclR family transcriptional regulator
VNAKGRCDPALDTICAKARLARATVVRTICTLQHHRFLQKVRRTRKSERSLTPPRASAASTPA